MVFAVRQGEIVKRIDCQFYLPTHRLLKESLEKGGFPIFKLGDRKVSKKIFDGPFGTQLKVEDYQVEGVPLIRVSNCRDGYIEETDELVFISQEKHHQLRRSEVLPRDILLTKAGAILGYCAVFPDTFEKGNITSHLASIRPTDNIHPEYLAAYLRSNLGNRQIYQWGNKTTRPELNTEEVRQIFVPLPPLEIQQRLVDAMESTRAARKGKLAEADSLLAGMDSYVLDALGLTLPPQEEHLAFAVTLGDIFKSKRFDAHFHQPVFTRAETELQNSRAKVFKLKSLLQTEPINRLDAREYTEGIGQKYLRVQNVRPFEVSLENIKYVSVEYAKDVILKAGDVLLTNSLRLFLSE